MSSASSFIPIAIVIVYGNCCLLAQKSDDSSVSDQVYLASQKEFVKLASEAAAGDLESAERLADRVNLVKDWTLLVPSLQAIAAKERLHAKERQLLINATLFIRPRTGQFVERVIEAEVFNDLNIFEKENALAALSISEMPEQLEKFEPVYDEYEQRLAKKCEGLSADNVGELLSQYKAAPDLGLKVKLLEYAYMLQKSRRYELAHEITKTLVTSEDTGRFLSEAASCAAQNKQPEEALRLASLAWKKSDVLGLKVLAVVALKVGRNDIYEGLIDSLLVWNRYDEDYAKLVLLIALKGTNTEQGIDLARKALKGYKEAEVARNTELTIIVNSIVDTFGIEKNALFD